MGLPKDLGRRAWRKYVVDGVAGSGFNKPDTLDIFPFVDQVDADLIAVRAVTDTVPAIAAQADEAVDTANNALAVAIAGIQPPKASVRILMTTNVVIASALENGDTLDGLTLVTGNRIALTGQTAPAENGVYVVPASGAAARSTDMDASSEIAGASFTIDAGTHASETWGCSTPAPITVGTTALTFIKSASASATTAEVIAARGGQANLGAYLALLAASVSNVALLSQMDGLAVSMAKLTEASGSVTPSCFRSFTFANATTYEHVVIAKAAERRHIQVISTAVGAAYTVDFDLVDGTISGSGANFVSASMTALGGGQYECKAVLATTATPTVNVQTRMSASGVFPYTGDGTSGLFVGSIVLRVQNTTTNLFPSSDPTNAAFTKTNMTAALTTTPESRVLPPMQSSVDAIDILVNGRLIADKIVEQSGAGSPSVYRSVSWTSGDTFVLDVIAKQAERTRLNLFSNAGSVFDCTFDLHNGTCSGTGATILSLGAGWYRCRVTGTAATTNSANTQHRVYPAAGGHPYTGDGASGLYLYRSTLSINGGPNVFPFSTDYSAAVWTKAAGVTVSANTGRYLGLLFDPTGLGSTYDDGRAALVGKKWAALGSSITAQAFYTTPLASSTGMVLTNLGVSGASLGVPSGAGSGGLGIYNAIASIPSDTEIVTLESGVNDYAVAEVTLGAINDTTTSTFYGALFAAVVAIRAQAPSAKIIFITPYSGGSGHATHKILRANGLGKYLNEYQQAVRDVAKLTGYPCIDIAGRSGIGYFTGATYMSDNLHINATGGTRYANCALDDLRTLSRAGFFGT